MSTPAGAWFITAGQHVIRYMDAQNRDYAAITKRMKYLGNEIQALKQSAVAPGDGERLSRDLKQLMSESESHSFLFVWSIVITVTLVESYLLEVLVWAAQYQPDLMKKSEQSVRYEEALAVDSIEDLRMKMRYKWARSFLDGGGPRKWMERLAKMGARGFDDKLADSLEETWGMRHAIVHRAGVVSSEMVRRHPRFESKLGKPLDLDDMDPDFVAKCEVFVGVVDDHFEKRCRSAVAGPGKGGPGA